MPNLMNESYDAHLKQELPSLVKGAGFRSQSLGVRRFESCSLHFQLLDIQPLTNNPRQLDGGIVVEVVAHTQERCFDIDQSADVDWST